jgi:hypothetical protein
LMSQFSCIGVVDILLPVALSALRLSFLRGHANLRL